MKTIKIMLVCMIACIFSAGCSKNPLVPGGMISYGATAKGNISSAPSNNRAIEIKYITAKLNIGKIEITTDGENWFEIYKGDYELKVSNWSTTVDFLSINSSVPPDEYHGIRISLNRNARIEYSAGHYDNTAWNGGTYYPDGEYEIPSSKSSGIYNLDYTETGHTSSYVIGGGTSITFSTRNGGITAPFKVESAKTIYIVMNVKPSFAGLSSDYAGYNNIYMAMRTTAIKP